MHLPPDSSAHVTAPPPGHPGLPRAPQAATGGSERRNLPPTSTEQRTQAQIRQIGPGTTNGLIRVCVSRPRLPLDWPASSRPSRSLRRPIHLTSRDQPWLQGAAHVPAVSTGATRITRVLGVMVGSLNSLDGPAHSADRLFWRGVTPVGIAWSGQGVSPEPVGGRWVPVTSPLG